MNDMLNQTKGELLITIKATKDVVEQAEICVNAYRVIKRTERPQQAHLLAWFLETAREKWFPPRPRNESLDTVDDLMSFFGDEDQEEADDEVLQDNASDVAETKITIGDITVYQLKFEPLIAGIINLYSNEGYSVEQYYTTLWEMMESLLVSYTDMEKGICLYFVLRDKRTPYQRIQPGLRMSDEDYLAITEAIMPAMKKMWFILGLPSSQKTETASQLLSVLDELETIEEKSVWLSQLIGAIEKNS